ncbi:MAG: hypothetical protein E7411_07890 [Ruminococcaceae bacterium]|nr:hypothetical protein [Oscillospiraceae bacterium]
MIFNLIHRPCGHYESYDFQRKCAHELNFKTTILIPSRQFDNERVMESVKEDNRNFNDEIGIWLDPLSDMPDTQVWLLSREDKVKTVKYSVDAFIKHFGYPPKCVGNYVMDSQLIEILKDYCPQVTTVVAGCFEEGVKVFHGCNNSWYLFSEGMSWNPWYPSKTQSVRPAESSEDWAGVVAVPHLSRDLVLGYEGRNDFFASHPANIQRGLANDGVIHNYDYNLVDQYRMQEDYNNGFSYYQIHVSPGWFFGNPNILDSSETTCRLYRETLEYLASLKEEGKLIDMHLSEFGEYYKKNVPLGTTDVGVGKDILFGSGKHYMWVLNSSYRALVDTFQGGSVGDLRPYIGKYEAFTGVDSDKPLMNSYPYLVQSQYRSGLKHHHEDGARTTLFVTLNGETLDMCNYPSKIDKVQRTGNDVRLELKPVTMKFKDGSVFEIQTVYDFYANGEIGLTRRLLSGDFSKAELCEYIKACYGFTEYPENMKGISLLLNGEKVADYGYNAKIYSKASVGSVAAVIPAVNTLLELKPCGEATGSVCDGHHFSPFFTLKLKYTPDKNTKEIKSWLNIKKQKA